MENYQELTEKKIRLSFPTELEALKYDQTIFYRNQIAAMIQNTKAVDYIVKDNDKLIFIEISDYRGQTPPPHGDLVDEVMQKVKDSIVGLFSAKINTEQELLKYAELLFNCEMKEFIIIFVLEEDSTRLNNSKSKRANMTQRLRLRLQSIFKAQLYICDCSDFQLIPNIDFKIEYIGMV